jgi:hypothetical protein
MAKRRSYLTRRDRQLLQFVERYRAATEQMLRRAVFGPSSRRANVHRVVRRLVRQGLLRSVPFGPGQRYVVLTRRGCRQLGASDRTPRPLTEQSLPALLAIAWFCVRSGVTRFTDREFRLRYPELWKPGLRSSAYYLTQTPQGLKLGMFLVDRGATSRRLKGKIRRLITQRASLPAFAALIEAKRFYVTVLTGVATQQQNLRRQLKRRFVKRVGRVSLSHGVRATDRRPLGTRRLHTDGAGLRLCGNVA